MLHIRVSIEFIKNILSIFSHHLDYPGQKNINFYFLSQLDLVYVKIQTKKIWRRKCRAHPTKAFWPPSIFCAKGFCAIFREKQEKYIKW